MTQDPDRTSSTVAGPHPWQQPASDASCHGPLAVLSRLAAPAPSSGQLLDILNGLDARFDCSFLGFGPYFFPDLAGTSEADEQAAINAGPAAVGRWLHRW